MARSPLFAALPFADKLRLHIEVVRERALADASAFGIAAISLADNGSTAVRHEASNSRIAALSISPMRCSPAAISWIAVDRRLRYLPILLFVFLLIQSTIMTPGVIIQGRRSSAPSDGAGSARDGLPHR